MYFIEFLGRMMSLSHLIFPSKGLDNDQSFEPGQAGSMENLKNNFPAISTFKNYIPDFNMIKTMFIEKYNLATWVNVHTFLLNSGKSFNRYEFFMALQCILLIYFPGMALGIVYQYYELDQQIQLIQKQDEEEDIYQVILQEMQQPQQHPQQQSISRQYIKQQLEEQGELQSFNKQSMSQSTPIMQFVQFIQRLFEQLIQTPQSILYQIQYQQDCQYINQTIQAMQQQTDQQYIQQTQCYQNQNPFICNQEDMIQDRYQDVTQYHQVHSEQQQVIIVMIQQKSQVLRATTNSTLNNENGGVNNMMIMVIKMKLPQNEGRQIVQF